MLLSQRNPVVNSASPSPRISPSLKKMSVADALNKLIENKTFDIPEPDFLQPYASIKKPTIFGKQVSFAGKDLMGTFDEKCSKFMLFFKHADEYIRLFVDITKKTVSCTVLTPYASTKCDVIDVSLKTSTNLFKILQFDKVETVLDILKTLSTFKSIRYFIPNAVDIPDIALPKPKYSKTDGSYLLEFPDYKVYIGFDGNASQNVLKRFSATLRIEAKGLILHMYKDAGEIEGDTKDLSKYWSIGWNVGTQFLNTLDVDKQIKTVLARTLFMI